MARLPATQRGAIWRFFGLLPLLFLLAGCEALLPEPEAPEVRVTSIAVESLRLDEQRYRVGLNLRNPNPYPLNVGRLRFTLALEGTDLFEGVGAEDLRLPAGGDDDFEVILSSDAVRAVTLIGGWLGGDREAFDYGIHGDARLSGWGLTLPFESRGRVELRRD